MCAQRVPVWFLHDLPGDRGLAGQVADVVRVGKAVVRPEALDPPAVDAHEQQARAAEFPLHAGVGRQRSGQPGDLGFAAERGVQPVERLQNAARQIVVRGQRLVLPEHPVGFKIIQDGVRAGAAGINADCKIHGNASFPFGFRFCHLL